jgi:riboflavin kinase/FMN adenylyltransferase
LAHGFDVTALVPVTQPDGLVYSSTAVRQALQTGDMAQATVLLGRDWSISGPVIAGNRLGRTLGYPTANIAWPADMLRPAYGVYAVTVAMADDTMHKAVASIGLRPTVTPQATEPLLEVHIFDFDGDLYGQMLDVHFKRFIRPEETFADLETLKQQMARDSHSARDLLA